MRTVKASNTLRELTKASEAALGKLGYQYGRGGREGVVEFVITRPFSFGVVLEELVNPYSHDRLLGFLAASSTQIRTYVHISVPEDDPQGIGAASDFVKEMVTGLKRKPWKGLGMVSGRTAKILWDRWLEPGQLKPGDLS